MKKLFFSIFCACGLLIAVQAQDSTTAREHIKYLSSKKLHGRGVAYDGERHAAEYLRDRLIEFGAEPLGEDFFQPYEMPAFAMEGTVKCHIGKQALKAGEDYRILPFSKSLNGEYRLIRIKPSVLISPQKIDAINKKYADILPQSLIYLDNTNIKFKKEKDETQYKTALASLKRLNPFNSAGIIEGVDKMPAWGLSGTNFKRNLAYIYIKADKICGKDNTIELYYTNELVDYTHNNVCGILPGTKHPEQYIVLTGHYDHLGAMGDELYFPGAHDNASGCAFLLNMAQYFSAHSCEYSIVFLFFAGEESGLLGSKVFTEHPLVPLKNIKYVINFDLLGGGDEGIMLVNSAEGKGLEIYKRLTEINENEHLLPKISQRGNAPNSDHYFFTQHKVPAIFMYTLGGKTGNYHDPSDSNENCSLTMFDNIFKLFRMLIEKEGE